MPEASEKIDRLVLDRARVAGADGIATDEITGMTAALVSRSTRRLVDQGLLFRGKLGHRTMRVFATADWAEAFQSQRRVVDTSSKARSHTTAPWKADAPINYPKNPDGSEAFKRTVCPPVQRRERDPIRTANYQPN